LAPLMLDFNKDKLAELDIYLGEPNEQVREGMRATLRAEGLRRTRSFGRLAELEKAMRERSPDLMVVSDNLDTKIFKVIKDIRHHKIGRNPFIVISFMVKAEEETSIRKAILSGADDVLIKPVAPSALLERVAQLVTRRLPFIATTDYVGPERRRKSDRPSKIKQLEVINTLQLKLGDEKVTKLELQRSIDGCVTQMMASKLDSHGMRLGYVCNIILDAYNNKKINKEVKENLIILVGVLKDAAKTAKDIGEKELSSLCGDLARQVEEMSENYKDPADSNIALIRKLNEVFVMAKKGSGAVQSESSGLKNSDQPGALAEAKVAVP